MNLQNQEVFHSTETIFFHEVIKGIIRKNVSKLDRSKATSVGDIPTEILKSVIDIDAAIVINKVLIYLSEIIVFQFT